MVELTGITKSFTPPISFRRIASLDFSRQSAVKALDNVSFSLPAGSILAILGPNGAGKTTLLKILSTLIVPDKGTAKINGLNLDKDEPGIKASIGLVTSSERSFYWRLTGRQNLEFFAAMYGLSGNAAAARIAELMELFKITYRDKRFDSYSTGMQQKFNLCRALLHNPAILLLDEPTRSLDYSSSLELKDLVKETLAGKHHKTVIFTTHHMDEAIDFADRFLILHKGVVHGFGTLKELRAAVKNPSATLGEIFVRLTAE